MYSCILNGWKFNSKCNIPFIILSNMPRSAECRQTECLGLCNNSSRTLSTFSDILTVRGHPRLFLLWANAIVLKFWTQLSIICMSEHDHSWLCWSGIWPHVAWESFKTKFYCKCTMLIAPTPHGYYQAINCRCTRHINWCASTEKKKPTVQSSNHVTFLLHSILKQLLF